MAVADAGYADTEELKKIDDEQIKVVVPSQRQALHEEEGPLSKSHQLFASIRNRIATFVQRGSGSGSMKGPTTEPSKESPLRL